MRDDDREPLAPGIYALGDEIHVDLDAFIREVGGDPADPVDVAAAERAIARVCARYGIAVHDERG
jgi:hypothetical protein